MTALAPHLTDYLVDHLPRHRNASAHTVATYAHSFTLLVRFAAKQRRCRPIDLQVEDLDPDLILAFLDHIEAGRQNSVSTRNARLAAVRSFFRYIEYKIPACLDQVLSGSRELRDQLLVAVGSMAEAAFGPSAFLARKLARLPRRVRDAQRLIEPARRVHRVVASRERDERGDH